MKKYFLFSYSLLFIFSCELFEPEQEEPTVKITSPKNNSFVHEVVNITADADDNKGIVYVEFYIDGETSFEMKDYISFRRISKPVNNVGCFFILHREERFSLKCINKCRFTRIPSSKNGNKKIFLYQIIT